LLGLLLISLGVGAASASAATVSGVLRDAGGDPLAGTQMTLTPQGSRRVAASAITGLDGSYALAVAPGPYTVTAFMSGGGVDYGLPDSWSFTGPLAVRADRAFDPTLPAASIVTVRALGAGDVPFEGALVDVPGMEATDLAIGGESGFQLNGTGGLFAGTDEAGELSFTAFDETAPRLGRQGTVGAPDGSGYLPTPFTIPTVAGPATIVVHMLQPDTFVTGTIRDANGDPVPGVTVTLGPSRDVTDAAGAYSLGVVPGRLSFFASLDAGGAALGLPEAWTLSGPLTVSGDRTFDVRLPGVMPLTVRVLDAQDGDAPLEGATVTLPGFEVRGVVMDGESGFQLNASPPDALTDADGETHELLFDGMQTHFGQPGTVTAPESVGYEPADLRLPQLDGATTVVERLPTPFYWISGTLREDDGTPVGGVDMSIGRSSVTTGPDGAYGLRANPGGNGLDLAMPIADGTAFPPNWTLSGSFTTFADRTLDVTLPKILHVTTRVLGDEEEPVPGTLISIPRFSYFFPLETFGELTNVQSRADPLTLTTDANGEARYAEFDGTQPTFGVAARLAPPPDSGYDARIFAPEFNRFDLLDVQHVHDSHAPTIVYDQSPDGSNGWWSGRPATVHVTASDPRIDTLACTVDGVAPRRLGVVAGTGTLAADLTIRGEGRHAIVCTATDRSANSATESTAALIDLTNPGAPTLAADRAPDFAGATGGWWADAVTVTATDTGDPLLADGSAGSGVDPGSVPAPQTFTTTGRHVVAASASDLAGNVSRTTRLAVRVDADAPTTTLTCPARAVSLGSRANATWDDDDAGSGLVGPNHGRVALDTSTPGSHAVDHIATDRVGHATASSCGYEVV
jgi:hypothetical protein